MTGLSVQLVVDATARHFRLRPAEIVAPSKRAELVRVRWAAMWLAHRHTGQTMTAIGRHLGNRDRTTVAHGIEALAARLSDQTDCELASDVAEIDRTLQTIAAVLNGLGSMPDEDIDPVLVSERVLQGPRGATSVSTDELRAMALAVLVATEPEANPLLDEIVVSAAAVLAALSEPAGLSDRQADALGRLSDALTIFSEGLCQ